MFRTIFIAVMLLVFPRIALGQEGGAPLECAEYVPAEERNDPKRLALRGVACFEAGEYVLALRHYRRARELSDANLLNAALGRTFQELGHPHIARRYYRDYLAGKIEDSEGRAKIEARLEAVEKELETAARVRVESSPPGATVYVVVDESHWEEIGVTPLDMRMRPGKHSFVVERDGYVRHTAQLDAGSKQDRIVKAELVREGAAFAVSGQRLRRSGIITMAASVPFLVVGPSLFFIGRNDRSMVEELPAAERPDATARARRLQNTGIVVSAVGVAALGTGLTLYLMGRSADTPDDDESEPKTALIPYTDGRTAGLLFAF